MISVRSKPQLQAIVNGGKTYAFVTDGHDGYLFTTEAGTGTTIEDAVKLSGATALSASDITTGAVMSQPG